MALALRFELYTRWQDQQIKSGLNRNWSQDRSFLFRTTQWSEAGFPFYKAEEPSHMDQTTVTNACSRYTAGKAGLFGVFVLRSDQQGPFGAKWPLQHFDEMWVRWSFNYISLTLNTMFLPTGLEKQHSFADWLLCKLEKNAFQIMWCLAEDRKM